MSTPPRIKLSPPPPPSSSTTRSRRKKKKISEWTPLEVGDYLAQKSHHPEIVSKMTREHLIDGRALLLLTEADLRDVIGVRLLGPLKNLTHDITTLKRSAPTTSDLRRHHRRRSTPTTTSTSDSSLTSSSSPSPSSSCEEDIKPDPVDPLVDSFHHRPQLRSTVHARNLQPEVFKALVAMFYLFVVTWITALVMVIVHDRVPDMEKYPPLPDLFLDHVPHIPWAFEMCEVTGTILLILWFGVLFFHKHRFILIRRFFALCGTVFLLRCVTMLITSLSVPGAHLKCNPRPYGDWMSRLYNAYLIWKGAGMSIQGVRTCGDYMFSGHTVALTMLNFFVTEYTTRRLYFIHTFSWLLNTFGIFFILAAHEHYSIDVFIAFYIASRLFLYYHTLANNQALMQRDSKRTKVWFPLFSYFESGIDGIVPNSYEWPITLKRIKKGFKIVSLALEKKFGGEFFVSKSSSLGFFRTKVNAFIGPIRERSFVGMGRFSNSKEKKNK